jgi:IS30 family transposase
MGRLRSSPGAPSLRREVERRFWCEVARGVTVSEAAVVVGVSTSAGFRWFRHGGGMPSVDLSPVSGRFLSLREREEIAILRAQGAGVREIARRVGRAASTISRELRRNCVSRGRGQQYRASVAQWKSELVARRPKPAKLVVRARLREYVQQRLAGQVCAGEGVAVRGPRAVAGTAGAVRGRDRRWVTAWSPEQISRRLRVDFPDDESMRISHEAIYQALYVQGRGALKRELAACLRTGRALRVPRARSRRRRESMVTAPVMISQRPAEAEDRAVPGHWEGDLIIGAGRSAIGTLVERSTRYTMLLHLPPRPGHGARAQPGPRQPLAGHGAEDVRNAIASAITTLPQHLRRSLTWDRGTEMAQHARLRVDTGIEVYFADPHSPWQRGTNENTNGLLRQYFPKGTDLTRWNRDELDAVATTLNNRPRKTLDWRTPAEALNTLLLSHQ